MTVIRVNKTANYTVMSNCHLQDRTLSLKAKGLLSMILSLPDDWNYTIGGLVAICVESEAAVKAALGELKRGGYLRIDKLLPSKETGGKYKYVYNIYEHPLDVQGGGFQEVENQPLENQGVENQEVENHPLYKNTNISSTNEQSTNISSTNKEEKRKRFTPPTVEEVAAYCEERKNGIDPEEFVNYYASKGWKVGRTTMQDWKAAVRTWESRQKKEKRHGANGVEITKGSSDLDGIF